MKTLVLGSGGREHAIAWKIHQSPNCDSLFVAPGNGGTSEIAENLDFGVNDFKAIHEAVLKYDIDLIIVGPEEPLVNGVVDYLKSQDELRSLLIVGPSSEGAQLEGSKDFAKQFMERHNIPTGKAEVFSKEDLNEGLDYLSKINGPYVLKADGLAAGKGVIITEDLEDAKSKLTTMLGGQFGTASSSVLVEEFLSGIEVSVFVVTDGKSYKILPEAKDYKRIGEGDAGPNTGGMGAISPVIFYDEEFRTKVEEKIIKPTIRGIESEGMDYKGFIFFGLIKVDDEPFVIEYNVRMGDPETEVVLPRVENDFLELMVATAKGELEGLDLKIDPSTASTVMLVSEGYPGPYEKGKPIQIEEESGNVRVFHAGTKIKSEVLVSNGGRVLSITGLGVTMDDALTYSYEAIKGISWDGMNYRKDIGFDLRKLGQ